MTRLGSGSDQRNPDIENGAVLCFDSPVLLKLNVWAGTPEHFIYSSLDYNKISTGINL